MSLELERAVIGQTLCLEGEAFPPGVLALESEYFTDGRHQEIWYAVNWLVGNRAPVDIISVSSKLKQQGLRECSAYLADLTREVVTTTNLEYYSRQLQEIGSRRLLQQRIKEIVARADRDDTAESISGKILEAIRSHDTISDRGGLVHIAGPLADVLADLAKRADDPDGYLVAKTGLVDLDARLALEAGDLTIIAGRPSMGKTALAGCIAEYCARDSTKGMTAMFSLEMSTPSLIIRLLQNRARICSENLPEAVKRNAIGSSIEHLKALNLYIDDRSRLSPDAMRQALTALPRVRLVIVDYLQLAGLSDRIESHYLKIGDITKRMKAIAKEFQCHVIVLSQLSRKVEDHKDSRPVLSDLRDSGNIEEDADNVLLLYRESYYKKGSEDGRAEIIISKQRKGPTGSVMVAWLPQFQVFSNLAR